MVTALKHKAEIHRDNLASKQSNLNTLMRIVNPKAELGHYPPEKLALRKDVTKNLTKLNSTLLKEIKSL